MGLLQDLEDLAAKAEATLAGAKDASANPTLADKVLAAVVAVLEAEGWTAPADPNAPQA